MAYGTFSTYFNINPDKEWVPWLLTAQTITTGQEGSIISSICVTVNMKTSSSKVKYTCQVYSKSPVHS